MQNQKKNKQKLKIGNWKTKNEKRITKNKK